MRFKKVCGFVIACLLTVSARVHCEEQLEQETISIMGNRGLPKTLYITPWKQLGAPLEGEELEAGVEADLAPVERDLFRRELELYREGYGVD